ncbi:MAG: MFS transporter, DHA1 family, tetracycline resistance protein [Parcubacteria bacterium C7867-006]|nr:MAG: MFS transporter, DHA1 family, tetracycline resistance protein [Parcubacteria bacterium C7867-006]
MEEKEDRNKGSNLRWWILLTVIVGTFLGRLDQTIVNLALPKIINDFGITVSSAGWIATAYILANAVFVPIWGKLGDTIGRKKVYIWGFGIFIVGSVLAGLSWNLSSMIVFRIIQAIAGSADYPTAMAIIAVTFKEGKERAQALGIWSSSFAAAVVFGPLLGGPLIDNFGWRSVFLINLPIGILGIVMAMRFINESRSEVKTKFFDWWGAFTLGGMLSSLVLVLEKGSDWGWLSVGSMICYFLVVVLLGLFIKIEQKAPEPIVDLKFFKIPAFVNALVNNFVVFMGMMGGVFLIPVFAQTFLGFNATETGYLFIPMAVAMMAASPLGGMLTGKVQSRYIIFASTLVAAIGIFLFTGLDPRSTALDIIIPLSVMAFGLGFGMAQRTNIIASVVPESEIGIASSILALVRNISGAVGIAIFATILNNRVTSNILTINSFSKLNSHNPVDIQKYIGLMSLKAQIGAYDYVFLVASIIVFLGAFTILFLKLKNERTDIKVHVEA